MRGFLLTYNPAKSGVDYFDELIDEVRRTGEALNNWSCGNRTDLPPGSALFLMRLGVEPKGLVGAGTALAWPFEELHWDEEKRRQGVTSMFVDFRFTSLSEDAYFSLSELEHRFPGIRWTPQSSGMELPEAVVSRLLAEWHERAEETFLHPDDIPPGTTYEEGAARTVVVNAYERDRRARTACIQHYGCSCAACGVLLEDRYGPVAAGFVHVHHVRPLSMIGEEYSVDPVADLRPLCPNCHAVIHLASPPMSIDDLRDCLAEGPQRGARTGA